MKKSAGIFVVIMLLLITGCTSKETIGQQATKAASNIPSDVAELFSKYGWTATECTGSSDARLPDSLITNVENSPMQFYWMRAGILSGDVGYDLLSSLGKQVKIEIYNLTGKLPEKYKPPVFQSIRGIVYRDGDGKIVGSLIDSGRHAGNSISLSGNDVEDITGMSLSNYWHKNYYNTADPVNINAEKRTAEEVIRCYFQGVATRDTAMQLSTLCVQIKLQSLFTNIDNSLPYNTTPELYQYLSYAKVISINRFSTEADTGITNYAVEIDAKTSESGKQVLGDVGTMIRYLAVGDENGMLRIFGDNTGP